MNKTLKLWNTYHTRGIKSEYLFRYMDRNKIDSFLTTKSLYMPLMHRFDDKLEGISTYDITEVRTAYQFSFLDREEDILPDKLEFWKAEKRKSEKILKSIKLKLERTQTSHYVSCWFNSNRESDGMWRFYAKENGFAIKVKRKDFQKEIQKSIKTNLTSENQKIVVGRIVYQDYPRVVEKENTVLYLAFRKDESFSHEKEYRIVIIDPNRDSKKSDHIQYKINGFEGIEIKVIAHPAMSEEEFQKNKKYFESLGDNIIVEKSELEPFYQFYDRINSLES